MIKVDMRKYGCVDSIIDGRIFSISILDDESVKGIKCSAIVR
jgi:hypothetical protein